MFIESDLFAGDLFVSVSWTLRDQIDSLAANNAQLCYLSGAADYATSSWCTADILVSAFSGVGAPVLKDCHYEILELMLDQ